MSDHIKGQSTGPKTVDGKAVSSQNARKDSIFVQGYLPWENVDEKQQQLATSVVLILEVVPKEPAPKKTDSGHKSMEVKRSE